MDERIILDDDPGEPSGPPLGLLAAIGLVAVAIAVIALRPSDVNPNSLSASPPTTLFVPPEAMTTSTVRPSGRSLSEQVPGLRGAIHFQVATNSADQDDQPPEGELWIWNVAHEEPVTVDIPGSIDISANRRYGLAISWNQADEGVLWLGPKADLQPAQILPGLTQAIWSRDDTRQLVTAQVLGNTTTLSVWQFSGADSEATETLTVDGQWSLSYFGGNLVGLSSSGTQGAEPRARMMDLMRRETIVDVPGVMVAGTSGPPVVVQCVDAECTEAEFRWLDEGALVPAPGQGWPIPSAAGPYVAVFDWQDATSQTVIYTRDGQRLMDVPSHGFVGAWSGDGRFFVYPKAEAQFGSRPALVFVDTVDQVYHEVIVPAAGDWFVTRIWYGP